MRRHIYAAWQTDPETCRNADARLETSDRATIPARHEIGEAGLMDAGGYLYITARTDDVIHVAGHRLSTGAVEAETAHPDGAHCAGVGDKPKGQAPLDLVRLNAGATGTEEEIERECVALVRQETGPVTAIETSSVDGLPETLSGKILPGTMGAIADGAPRKMPATIDDAAVLDAMAERIGGLGAQIS